MPGEIVLAAYRPRPGREPAVLDLLRQHVPTLRRLGLATDRPVLLLRAPRDGTLIEVFEWASGDAARRAHEHPDVDALWTALAAEAEFPPLAAVEDFAARFPHLAPVDGVVR